MTWRARTPIKSKATENIMITNKHANYQYGIFWIDDKPVDGGVKSSVTDILAAAEMLDDVCLTCPIKSERTFNRIDDAVFYHREPTY